MKIQNTESSASSAGYKYQDLVALEKIIALLTDSDIQQVIIDKSNTPHIEDVIIEYSHYTEYIQIKHSNSEELSTLQETLMMVMDRYMSYKSPFIF